MDFQNCSGEQTQVLPPFGGNCANMSGRSAKPGFRGERMLFTNTTLSKARVNRHIWLGTEGLAGGEERTPYQTAFFSKCPLN